MKRKRKPSCAVCALNQAALDDACRKLKSKAAWADILNGELRREIKVTSELELACELNMSAYEDSQMHARVEHDLLTEAERQLKRTQEEVKMLHGEIAKQVGELTHLREQVQSQDQRIWQANFDVQFADAIRRQAERDLKQRDEIILAQSKKLKLFVPWSHVVCEHGIPPDEKCFQCKPVSIGTFCKAITFRRGGASVGEREKGHELGRCDAYGQPHRELDFCRNWKPVASLEVQPEPTESYAQREADRTGKPYYVGPDNVAGGSHWIYPKAAHPSAGQSDASLEHLCFVYLRHMNSIFDLGRLAEANKKTLAAFVERQIRSLPADSSALDARDARVRRETLEAAAAECDEAQIEARQRYAEQYGVLPEQLMWWNDLITNVGDRIRMLAQRSAEKGKGQ